MADINESMALGEELGEAMSQQIGPMMDEDELADELDELESEMMDEELMDAPTIPSQKISNSK